MAVDHVPRKQHVKRADAAYAINSHYVARAGDAGIDIHCLQDKLPPFCLQYDTGRPQFDPVLALSPTRQNLLAAANGSRILVFNVSKKRTRCVLKGNGRVVTSVSFSEREHEIVATGAVDGSICVWSIKQPSRPLHHLNGLPGVCNHIAMHSLHAGLIATAHHCKLAVWSLLDLKLLAAEAVLDSKVVYLAWRSRESAIGVSSDGCAAEATFGPLSRPPKGGNNPVKTNGSDHELDGPQGMHDRSTSTTTTSRLPTTVQQASTLGVNGMVVLPVQSDVLYFYSYSVHESTYTELWRLHFDARIECFALRRLESGIDVVVFSGGTCPSYSVPAPVLDAMRWTSNHAWMLARSTFTSKGRPVEGKMLPEKPQGRKAMPVSSPSRASHAPPILDTAPRKRVGRVPLMETAKSDQRSMTSSLELPKERGHVDKDDSPMPFLSPSIPARKHDLITPLDEDLSLLPRSSFDSVTSTATHGHDSDSDDETFADNLRHSSSFLPGGVNVPLPRTCGAAFAPNGKLVTFFPFQPRPGSAVTEKMGPEKHSGDGQSIEATSLFPSFANFGASDVWSALGSEQSGSHDDTFFPKASPFGAHTPSLARRPSWSAKVSPVKTTMRALPTANKVSVSVHDFEALTPTRKLLTTSYNICAEDPQSAANLSLLNAEASISAAMYEAAEAWRLLAIILEPRSVPRLRTESIKRGKSALPWIQRATQAKDITLATKCEDIKMEQAAILQSSHPLGRIWAIDQLFTSLEQQADVQLLACMSAVLVRAFGCQDLVRSKPRINAPQSDSTENQSSEVESAVFDVTMIPPGVPVLRANSSAPTRSEKPPMKRKTSQNSSRNTSQPATPYLDSSASTPPLIFPPLARHSSRVSHSGSASPEHHRSSFSIAAKNYAASIAEKFASYGSSPPARKHGTGSANELSTSLPNASAAGSWSKSVSFASNLGVGEPSNRSLSLAQEDDKYDSDTTIDDSLPHTPKTPGSTVSFKLKNEASFIRILPQEVGMVLPEAFLTKSALWRRHHAEQLRSWALLQEAAELEAVLGVKTQSIQAGARPLAVVCQGIGARDRVTCNICYCVIHTAKQLCPICLHTAHPRCLDKFISALGNAAYTCPSGCGCDCNGGLDLGFGADEHIWDVEQGSNGSFLEAGHVQLNHQVDFR